MFKKATTFVLLAFAISALVFCIGAKRPLKELLTFCRAGATKVVEGIENTIPDNLLDKKNDMEMQAAQRRLFDQKINLNMSKKQLRRLDEEIRVLNDRIRDRQELIKSATAAVAEFAKGPSDCAGHEKIRSKDVKRDLESIVFEQKKDRESLNVKLEGRNRLRNSIGKCEIAIEDFGVRLKTLEQQLALLTTRRDQAKLESTMLDLVEGTTSETNDTGVAVARTVSRLENQISRLESENEVRRELAQD